MVAVGAVGWVGSAAVVVYWSGDFRQLFNLGFDGSLVVAFDGGFQVQLTYHAVGGQQLDFVNVDVMLLFKPDFSVNGGMNMQ